MRTCCRGRRGHAADPEPRRARLVVAHRLGVGVAGKDLARLRLVEADVGGQADQRFAIGDRQPLGEAGAEQPLLERILAAVQGGEVEQPVRVEGVAGARAGEIERDAVGGGDAGHALDHLLGRRLAGAILARQPLGVAALAVVRGRRRRIQLERVPADDDRVAMRELRQRRVEPPLADVAPWTDDVGPDIDGKPLVAHADNISRRRRVSQRIDGRRRAAALRFAA